MWTFSLKDIDPLSIRNPKLIPVESSNRTYYRGLITLQTTNQKETIIQQRQIGNKSLEPEKMNYTLVWFNDSSTGETGKRLLKALKHAIKLCGGKVAPF